jgi:hypothetical protein
MYTKFIQYIEMPSNVSKYLQYILKLIIFYSISVHLMRVIGCESEEFKDCTNGLEWREMQYKDSFPNDAIVGGYDVDYEPLYICRAAHRSNPGVPGKASPAIGCRISFGGREHIKNNFQVLCNPNNLKLEWKRLNDPTALPNNAVKVGITIKEEQQYIGRCLIKIGSESSLVLGKVHKLSKGYPLYFPFEGGEITCWQYDILVCN